MGLDKADHQGSEVGLVGFGVWLACKLMGVKGLMRKVKGEVVPNVAISPSISKKRCKVKVYL